MITPGDAQLAARDLALPGLAALLDRDQLIELLQPELSVDRKDLKLSPYYIRYKRATNCLVGFRGTYRQNPVHLYARLHRPGEASKANKALQKPLANSSLGPGGLLLQDHCLLCMFFPNDRELQVVHKLDDPAFRADCLNRLLSGGVSAEDCDLSLLRYKPERRWVGRIRVGDEHQYLIKAHDRKFALNTTTGIQNSLQEASLHIRPRLGVIASHRLALYPWIPGRQLGKDADADQLSRIGSQLARLHSLNSITSIPLSEQADKAPEAQLRTALDSIADIAPDQVPRTEELTETILKLWYGQPHTLTKIRCRIHGDFSSDQVIMDDDQPWFIDFDRTTISHPTHDLGSFLARLHHEHISGILSTTQLATHSQALIKGYCETSDWPLAALVRPATALELLKLAPEAFRRRMPDWPERLNQVLTRTGQILSMEREHHAA